MSDTNELLGKILEKQEQTNELLKKVSESLSKDFKDVPASIASMNNKCMNIELRFCALFGQGTDASRMTSLYLRGHTALWSEQTRQTIVKMVYNKKSIDAIAYKDLFDAKDTRRMELCAVVFYETAIRNTGELYNAFSDRGRPEGPAQMAPIWGWLCH